MARKRHATAAHMKPKLYFPRVAVVPADLNASRPCTNAALCFVSVLVMKGRQRGPDGLRHQRGRNGLKEEADRAESAGKEAANAAEQGKETKDEGASREEEGDELKGEHEPRF